MFSVVPMVGQHSMPACYSHNTPEASQIKSALFKQKIMFCPHI